MSSSGGGGGKGAILALVLLVAFVVMIWIALASFPPSGFSPSGSEVSSSTAGSRLPIAPPAQKRHEATSTGSGQTPNFGPYSAPSAQTSPSGGAKGTSSGSSKTPSPPPPSSPSSPATSTKAVVSPPKVSPQNIPKGFTLEQLSPYFQKIRLGGISVGGFGLIGQVTLSTSLTKDEYVLVTGWRVQGKGALFVPKAVRSYDAAGLAPEVDIVMTSGDTLSMYSGGTSAIGKNVRLNKCLGYLPTLNKFTPSLPRYCPSLNRAEITGFSGQCQNYITSLGSCGIPNFNEIRVPSNDYACRAYLEKLNYAGCVERYSGDADFLKNQIYAWIGDIPFDKYHDTIYLFDNNGLLVDMRQY